MIDDPTFSLTPDECWERVPNEEPDQYNFRDAARDIIATLSGLSLRSDPDRLDRLAQAVVEFRLHAESDAGHAFGHIATIYEPIVVPQSWGQAVAYYGHDDTGRQFSFSGIVTPRSVISLYMSSGRLSEAELAQAMDEVLTQIEFDRTPLGRQQHLN